MSSDLFVVSPGLHTFFRFTAAFVIAPLLIWRGYLHQDLVVAGIGVVTLVVDSYTFAKSVKARKRPSP